MYITRRPPICQPHLHETQILCSYYLGKESATSEGPRNERG